MSQLQTELHRKAGSLYIPCKCSFSQALQCFLSTTTGIIRLVQSYRYTRIRHLTSCYIIS